MIRIGNSKVGVKAGTIFIAGLEYVTSKTGKKFLHASHTGFVDVKDWPKIRDFIDKQLEKKENG